MNNNINKLVDFLPLALFFIVYYITHNIFMATAVCIIISWLIILIYKFKAVSIPKSMLINAVILTILGSLTIILHNKMFVMLKPSVLFWVLGLSIIIAHFFKKNGAKVLLSKDLNLPDRIWSQVNLAWAIFFILMGFLNLFIAFNYSEYVWVKFKVFGSLILTIFFSILTAVYISIKSREIKQK